MTITISKLKLAIGILAVVLIAPATAWATDIFDDVDDAAFYAAATEWAKDNDITTGSPAGSSTFKPDDAVTRGESVTFLKRYDDNVVQPALDDRYTKAEADTALAGALPTFYFAEVEADGTATGNTSAGVTVDGGGDGSTDVNFPADISACHWQATVGDRIAGFDLTPIDGEISLQSDLDGAFPFVVDPAGIFVATRDSSGATATMPFFLMVTCP